jgi:CRP-like cAMP-binding protein
MNPKNLLLTHLPREVYDRIEPDLELVSLSNGEIIHKPGEPIRLLYFPETCMISITVRMGDGRTVEAGAIGRREVVGINAFMGGRETTQTEYIVQLPGAAFKIAAEPLQIEFNRNTEMRDLMLKYTQAMIAQISQNVACNRLHDMDQRCARWLLEVRDRIESDTFPLTHEFIAEMLGVRRSGVSETALKLKEKGVIEYARGHIEITDVEGLKNLSCECYEVLKDEYDRLLGVRSVADQRNQRTLPKSI